MIESDVQNVRSSYHLIHSLIVVQKLLTQVGVKNVVENHISKDKKKYSDNI